MGGLCDRGRGVARPQAVASEVRIEEGHGVDGHGTVFVVQVTGVPTASTQSQMDAVQYGSAPAPSRSAQSWLPGTTTTGTCSDSSRSACGPRAGPRPPVVPPGRTRHRRRGRRRRAAPPAVGDLLEPAAGHRAGRRRGGPDPDGVRGVQQPHRGDGTAEGRRDRGRRSGRIRCKFARCRPLSGSAGQGRGPRRPWVWC